MSDVHGSCPCSTHTHAHTHTHLHVSTLVVPGRRFAGAPEGGKACRIISLSLSLGRPILERLSRLSMPTNQSSGRERENVVLNGINAQRL